MLRDASGCFRMPWDSVIFQGMLRAALRFSAILWDALGFFEML